MTSLAEVVAATCRIEDPDGRLAGSGFVALEGAYVITCHHVIRGLSAIRVSSAAADEGLPATYDPRRSAPGADLAVLAVPGLGRPPVQLGELRVGVDAAGVGFRPTELAAEPRGRVFSGRLTLGQELQLPVGRLPPALAALAVDELPAWAREPAQYHAGEVANFAVAGGLEQGVSGGPVYDSAARRVVGVLRAIEGSEQAYVLPLQLLGASWPDLLATNREQVADSALDALSNNYGVALTREGARAQRPQPWRDFEPLLALHRRFAGRAEELARLDRLVAAPKGCYALVTGPSGYGKTALLANWARRLSDHGRTVVLHFITSRVDGALSARDVLGSLCRQLMAVHQLGGDLPAVEADLRHLFVDLLQLDPGTESEHVVIVDGIDEAMGTWRPEGLWPSSLPASVHVVLAARSIADTDWLERLGLPPDRTEVVALDRLSEGEIAQLVADVLDGDEAMAQRVADVTGGDPFYVRDIVDDLARGGALSEYPVGHLQYLRGWWIEAREHNPGPGFADLMGTLAVARAPLGEAELARIDDDDALTGADLPVLIASARRYMEGSDAGGYRLAHHRIEEFIRQTMADSLAVYRRRMSDFCLREPSELSTERERRYALGHALEHLLDEGRVDDAYALLSAPWIARHFRETGSYRLVLDQLGQLAAYLADTSSDPEQQALIAALVAARETARELIARLPVDALVAWTELGGAEQVLSSCDALSPYRGEAAQPLIAVAGPLLAHADPALHAPAAGLLTRAIGMLPYVRTTKWLLDRLDELRPVLALAPASAVAELVDQLASVADAMPNAASRAITVAHAAVAAAGAGDVAQTAELLAAARGLAAELEPAGDAALVRVILLPAARYAEPGAFRDTVRAVFAEVRAAPVSSLESDLLARWLRSWQPHLDEWAPELLGEDLQAVVTCAPLLTTVCELGEPSPAIDKLAIGVVAREDPAAAAVVIEAAPALRRLGTIEAERLIQRSLAIAARDVAAVGHAALGDWDAALSAAPEPLEHWLALPLASHVQTAAAATALADAATLDDYERARLDAALARRLVSSDPDQADAFRRRSVQRSLATLPEGDTDRVLVLTAIAHVHAGEDGAAERLAARLMWPQNELMAYRRMIEASLDRADPPLERWAGVIRDRLEAWSDTSFLDRAVAEATACAGSLADVAPAAAEKVFVAAEALLLSDPTSTAGAFARIGATWYRHDPVAGTRALDYATWRAAAIDDQRADYFEALASVPPAEAERQLRGFGVAAPGHDDSGRHRAFLADAARAAALARFAPDEALDEVRRLIAALPAVAAAADQHSSRALIVVQLMRDLTGRRSDAPRLIGATAAAVAALSDAGIAAAAEAAHSLAGTALDVAADDRQGAVRALCEGLGRSAPAADDASAWLPALLDPGERATAAGALLEAGRLDAAAALAAGADGEEELMERVTAARGQSSEPVGALEQTLLEGEDNDLVRTLLALDPNERDETLAWLVQDMAGPEFQQPRYRMLDFWAPTVLLLLRDRGGTAALDRMVDAFQEMDDRLREAARLSVAV